jgi:hypothetical protein
MLFPVPRIVSTSTETALNSLFLIPGRPANEPGQVLSDPQTAGKWVFRPGFAAAAAR